MLLIGITTRMNDCNLMQHSININALVAVVAETSNSNKMKLIPAYTVCD